MRDGQCGRIVGSRDARSCAQPYRSESATMMQQSRVLPADHLGTASVLDETSARFPGWRVVIVCFVMAVFSWGFGFYGQGVYLAELSRLHGWPISTIATASTAYYLLSAVLVIFVSDAVARLGARRFLLCGIACLAVATASIGWIETPWQLYACY